MRSQEPQEIPTPEDFERIIAGFSSTSVTGARNRAMTALMWRMGLEVADVIALKLGDLLNPPGRLPVGDLRTPGARRLVIHPKVRDTLHAWLTELFRMRFPSRLSAATPLFPTLEKGSFGRELSPSYVRSMILRVAEKAAMGGSFGVQSFRDGLAAELRSLGYDIRAVQLYLGDQTQSRARRYGEVPPGSYRGDGLKDPAWCHPDPLSFSIVQGCEEQHGEGRLVGYGIGLRTVEAFADGHYEVSSGTYQMIGLREYREELSFDDVVSGLRMPPWG